MSDTKAPGPLDVARMVISLEEIGSAGSGFTFGDVVMRARAVLKEADALREAAQNQKPIRVIVDMTGGVFNGAIANAPVDVLVIDVDDEGEEAESTVVPGFTRYNGSEGVWSVWAEASVEPDAVREAFDGRVELNDGNLSEEEG